ncbi:hypothetical protein, partial [Sphingomonas sp. SRS2]|uniref:hypothetical protein n=1 Tax=Sphingomonas sp. SRS2 TaxID=133190 RepID=UPI0006184A50
PLPYRSGTSFLAWAIVNNNQPVPDVFSKMTKIAASGRLGLIAPMAGRHMFGHRGMPSIAAATHVNRDALAAEEDLDGARGEA